MVKRPVRVLLVEDNPSFLHMIEGALREPNEHCFWNISVAADGEQALDLLFAEQNSHLPLPELILLDWNLPNVQGSEVLRLIKKHRHLHRIPVLIFSSSNSPRDIEDAYEEHANGFVPKPDTLAEMAALIESIAHFWTRTVYLPAVVR